VTAAEGESLTFDATRSDNDRWPEGTVYFDGPDGAGRKAADLGTFPLTYRVVLTLNGERYFATAAYPEDVQQGNDPSVDLRFTPQLPALD
jgi:hypothetical protein